MKTTIFAATLAAIATGVAALPAPVLLTPESLALLRRTDQVQQNAQIQQQQAAPQDAQKKAAPGNYPNTDYFPSIGAQIYTCYDAWNRPFLCDATGSYIGDYPQTGLAPYYSPYSIYYNWQGTRYGSGAAVNNGNPGYLGALGRSQDGTTQYPGTPVCGPGANGGTACVA